MNVDNNDIKAVLDTLDEYLIACARERVRGDAGFAMKFYNDSIVIARTLEWLGIKTFKRGKHSKFSLISAIDNKIRFYERLFMEHGENGELEHSDEEA